MGEEILWSKSFCKRASSRSTVNDIRKALEEMSNNKGQALLTISSDSGVLIISVEDYRINIFPTVSDPKGFNMSFTCDPKDLFNALNTVTWYSFSATERFQLKSGGSGYVFSISCEFQYNYDRTELVKCPDDAYVENVHLQVVSGSSLGHVPSPLPTTYVNSKETRAFCSWLDGNLKKYSMKKIARVTSTQRDCRVETQLLGHHNVGRKLNYVTDGNGQVVPDWNLSIPKFVRISKQFEIERGLSRTVLLSAGQLIFEHKLDESPVARIVFGVAQVGEQVGIYDEFTELPEVSGHEEESYSQVFVQENDRNMSEEASDPNQETDSLGHQSESLGDSGDSHKSEDSVCGPYHSDYDENFSDLEEDYEDDGPGENTGLPIKIVYCQQLKAEALKVRAGLKEAFPGIDVYIELQKVNSQMKNKFEVMQDGDSIYPMRSFQGMDDDCSEVKNLNLDDFIQGIVTQLGPAPQHRR